MNKYHILTALADGKFHSGEKLAAELGISRSAVWKKLGQLEKSLGLNIYAVRGQGYRLAEALNLLDVSRVNLYLDPEVEKQLTRIELEISVPSTNSQAAQVPTDKIPYVCISELQTEGRGRRGKAWVSPFAKNLYLSLAWQLDGGSSLDGLSLCVGIACVRAIESLGIKGAELKWPNDILWGDAKLAGILIEVVGEVSGPFRVVVGVGINVAMPLNEGALIDQQWTTLENVAGRSVERNELAGQVLNELVCALNQFEISGLSAFDSEWQRLDMLNGKSITINNQSRSSAGIARGITDTGALILETDQGLQHLNGGEISVRETT